MTMPLIPEFLLVKNRVPLAPELAEKLAAIQAKYIVSDRARWNEMQEVIKTARATAARRQREKVKMAAERDKAAALVKARRDRVAEDLIRRGLLLSEEAK